jgi:hypothetical protein
MDLATGVGQVVGFIGFTDIDGLAFNAAGQLFGADTGRNRLVGINLATGAGTDIGSRGAGSFNNMGLAFGSDGTLYMSSNTAGGQGQLFTVDAGTGHATLLSNFAAGLRVRSLGFSGGRLFGWSNQDTLLDFNLSTGAPTVIGAFDFRNPDGSVNLTDGYDGMDADPATGQLWAIAEYERRTYTLDPGTGKATVRATSLTCDGVACSGFNSLAIAAAVPEPGSFALAGLGLLGLGLARRRPAPAAQSAPSAA